MSCEAEEGGDDVAAETTMTRRHDASPMILRPCPMGTAQAERGSNLACLRANSVGLVLAGTLRRYSTPVPTSDVVASSPDDGFRDHVHPQRLRRARYVQAARLH